MKKALKLKSFIAILLIMCLAVFALASCNEEKDPPDPEESEDLDLIVDGEVKFQVVKTAKLGSKGIKKVNAFIEQLEELGLEVEPAVDDKDADSVKECEIIIGYGAQNREGCNVDFHEVGEDGYIIKVVGTKVVIAGGSDEAISTAIDTFCKKVLGIKSGVDSLEDANVWMEKDEVYRKRAEYDVTDIKVGDKQISLTDGYYLDFDGTNKYIAPAANTIREDIFTVSGIWLPLLSELPAGETAEHIISIKSVANAGKNAFQINIDSDSNIKIECQTEYLSGIMKGVNAFLDKNIRGKSNTIRIYGDLKFTYAINVVRYTEFGAVGDGKTDDFKAIQKTHEYANENGMKVLEDANLTYYIGSDSYGAHINVETDVDWGRAKFIIDDYNLTPHTKTGSTNDRARQVFYVNASDRCASYEIDATALEGLSLKAGTAEQGGSTNVGLTFAGKTMLALYYTGQKVFIRWGGNANNGGDTFEQIIVEANGDISPETPLAFCYPRVDRAVARLVDETPITIEGGVFTTWANQACYDFPASGGWLSGNQYYYYSRGIGINRSNVTIKDMKHYVEKEGDIGYPYNAWFAVGSCYNTLIENCIITGHKAYDEDRPGGGGTTMGSYDLSATGAIGITWKDVKQSNSITSQALWGIMGSNNCKNIKYDGCKLSRFDAHNGTYNATIINSDIGSDINLIGWGEALIENTTIHSSNRVVALRVDYGATWRGVIKIKNVTMNGIARATGKQDVNANAKPLKDYNIVEATWKDHEFGNLAYLPSIDIDGFNLPEGSLTVTLFAYNDLVASSFDYTTTTNLNPLYVVGSPELPTYSTYMSVKGLSSDKISVYMSLKSTYLDNMLKNGTIENRTPAEGGAEILTR